MAIMTIGWAQWMLNKRLGLILVPVIVKFCTLSETGSNVKKLNEKPESNGGTLTLK